MFKTSNIVSDRNVKFSKVIYVKTLPFFAKKCEELLHAKANNFSAKNITTIDIVSTVRLNKSSTNDFV